MFGKRPDGTLLRDLTRLRRFMPYVSPRRNDALVLYPQEILVDDALRFLREFNRDRPHERRATLFHLYLRSLARAFRLRPGVNRFEAGGKLWQRDGMWITFSAKQKLKDGSPMLTVKRRFDEDESFEAMVDGILDGLVDRRSGKRTQSDKEVDFALQMPGFLVRAGMRALGAANHMGLLPKSMIEDDPLFTSVFVANLGSVGLEAGYHHLWEYGTCSVFAVMGRVRKRPDGRRYMSAKYSYDERVEDGLYAAGALELIKEGIEHPDKL